jgi:hypothetical protein
MGDLLVYGVKEKLRYARPILNWQHRKMFQRKLTAENAESTEKK